MTTSGRRRGAGVLEGGFVGLLFVLTLLIFLPTFIPLSGTLSQGTTLTTQNNTTTETQSRPAILRQVSSFMPSSPTPRWSLAVFSVACGDKGPGIFQFSNVGEAGGAITNFVLSYDGIVYSESKLSCIIQPGSTISISVRALAVAPPTAGTPFTAWIVTGTGVRLVFTGVWQ